MQTKKMVHIALLLTFAVVIHTVEAIIPVPLPVPGAKLGLANIITLLTLCFYGLGSGLTVAVLRSILGSIFAGNFLGFGFFFSLAGGLLSTLVMAAFLILERRNKISLVSVSIVGAVSHNTAQVVTAAFLIGNLYLIGMYLPLLLALALPTGFFTGLAAGYLQQALRQALPGLASARAGQEV
jgi:heptaprenyl diphosphate synthase